MKNEKIILLKDELRRHVKGREDLIDTVILALCSNEHVLIIGKHGEAKSFLVHKLAQITSLQVHYQQVHNELTLKEVVGLLDPLSYQQGKLNLLKTRFWSANILFFDEFLRGRSEFLDFLLEVMIERKCSKTVLGEVQLPQLISVIATSNPLTEEYNTERLDLAMKDRFSFIVNVDHLIENEANREVIKSILEDNELETRE
ncbi:MAG: AAA family ATPase, partial [Candidatus Heimdallarchaeaceae archaeon]